MIYACAARKTSFADKEFQNANRVFGERMIRLFVNEQPTATFMCTPLLLWELTVGYLITSGYIAAPSAISSLTVQTEIGAVYVTADACTDPVSPLRCMGNGLPDMQSLPVADNRSPSPLVPLHRIEEAAKTMVRTAELYHCTGGVHSAASGDGKLLFCCEDVGRTNALDKAVGAAILHQLDLSSGFIILTGRIAFEILLKAAMARTPILASLNIPSDMAVEAAHALGITLIGKLLHPKQHIYTHANRIC